MQVTPIKMTVAVIYIYMFNLLFNTKHKALNGVTIFSVAILYLGVGFSFGF
jgi:hypothetical protein